MLISRLLVCSARRAYNSVPFSYQKPRPQPNQLLQSCLAQARIYQQRPPFPYTVPKMKDISSIESLNVPEGVTVAIKARTVTVEGPRGKLEKRVGHVQMDIQQVSPDSG